MLREMHERPEGMDVSSVCLSALEPDSLIKNGKCLSKYKY